MLAKSLRTQFLKRSLPQARHFSKQLQKAQQHENELREADQKLQFSKTPTSMNFGDLPAGEIPEPLKYDREAEVTTISNGIRVVTYPNSTAPLSVVGVFIGAGSRNETLETSGAAHFLEHLHFKGSKKRTRYQLEIEVENMGSQLNAYTSREFTLYHMQSFPNDVPKSVEILGDMLCNSVYDNYHHELEKDTIWQELESVNQDSKETLMENVYYNIYREHMMGQPILGDIDNIYKISREMVVDFHNTNYFGENMVIVGTGKMEHQTLVDLSEQHFSNVQRKAPRKINGLEKAIFNPGMLFIRDDEMINSSIGVFYDAPSWHHKDFYSFLLLQRIFGNYTIDKNAEHLNDVKKQYNSMQAMLGDLPDVTRQECLYSPYSDCGIFGNWFYGNEVFTRQMNYCGVCLPTIYSHYINDVEVVRGRNTLYNELLTLQSSSEQMQQIGQQFLYLNRMVPRSEIAKRVSHIDSHHMKHLCYDWFYDAEPSFTNWGPIETTSCVGSYKYFKINTMSTVTNSHHSLFN